MTRTVVTPLTQALEEGKLTRSDLRELMTRRNGPALLRLVVWVALLFVTGGLIWVSLGTWLLLPAMFIHGIVLVHHFSLQHECVHYTVFRTRWLNDLVGNICGWVIGLPHQFFRFEHCDHHTYTQLEGEDPEKVPMPQTLWDYVWYISAIPYWRTKITEMIRHAAGRLTEDERRFVLRQVEAMVFWEARLMVATYLTIFSVMIFFQWWAPLWFWLIPLALGEPVMRFIRMTEHVGRPQIAQMRENTRTSLVSAPWRFLCWNMNYHAEHHYVSSVPFHALPKLHEKLKAHIHVEPGGYLGAHRDILRQVLQK